MLGTILGQHCFSFLAYDFLFDANDVWFLWQEMLLLLLPLLNSSSVKNLLRPFSKDKSSSSDEDTTACPICQATPIIPFVALPCQHRYISGHLLSSCIIFLLFMSFWWPSFL
jgi:hypothetical protein